MDMKIEVRAGDEVIKSHIALYSSGLHLTGILLPMRHFLYLPHKVGCFVPAEEATLPCLDALYVRVGARDDLCSRRSTLLVGRFFFFIHFG